MDHSVGARWTSTVDPFKWALKRKPSPQVYAFVDIIVCNLTFADIKVTYTVGQYQSYSSDRSCSIESSVLLDYAMHISSQPAPDCADSGYCVAPDAWLWKKLHQGISCLTPELLHI